MICLELCKRLKFNHTEKKYAHKSESVFKNKMHKILWCFDIQTERPIPTRRPNFVSIHKKYQVDFAVPADYKGKRQTPTLTRELNMKVMLIPNVSRWPWNGPQGPCKVTGRTEDQRKNQDHSDDNTVKIR